MTSSRPVVMKFALIPKNSSVCGVNLDSWLLDKILYTVGKSDIPLQLLQSVLSPFLQIGKMIDSFQYPGNSFLFKIVLISLYISENCSTPWFDQFCWDLIKTW